MKYEIIARATWFEGKKMITKERTVCFCDTYEALMAFVNKVGESYSGEIDEFEIDLEDMGCASIGKYTVFAF